MTHAGTFNPPLDIDTERELTSFASQIARKLRLLRMAGREDSDAYRSLVADRRGALDTVSRSRDARSERQSDERREREREQTAQQRREDEHKAAVAVAADFLREALAGGARDKSDVLGDAQEAGLIEWHRDDNMPMSVGGRWTGPGARALTDALHELGVKEYAGNWTLGFVNPHSNAGPAMIR